MQSLLLVEDDSDIRESLASLLREEGYSVYEAADPTTGLATLRSLRPDLVLLDYGLPLPEDGEGFLRAKAADSGIGEIPVILITGYALPSEKDGTVAVLRKPFDFDQLAALIQEILGPPQKPRKGAVA